jgi:protocatechuate 3,4-dioxygenase beta subunit
MRIAKFFIAVWLLSAFSSVAGAECEPTRPMPRGTHYSPITTEKTDVGSGLLVQGKVLSAADCSAIAGAKIGHWQANSNGKYVDELRAYLFSAKDGSYRFNTEWPAAFVPHIHFEVQAEGFVPLTTQWVGSEVVEQISFDLVLTPQ